MKRFFLFTVVILWGQFLFAEENNRILSSNFSVIKSSSEEIQLDWKGIDSTKENPFILLFIPGPVADATYTIDQFEWVAENSQRQMQGKGNEKNYPKEKYRISPFVHLREIGELNGCRLLSLSIESSNTIYSPSAEENQRIRFPSGRVQVKFPKQDKSPFLGFPKDIDPIVKKLIANYPPIRSCRIKPEIQPFPEYLNSPSVKITTNDTGILQIPVEKFLSFLPDGIAIESLALYCNRETIPFAAAGPGGPFRSSGIIQKSDILYLYCPLSQSPFSSETVLWATQKPQDHREIQTVTSHAQAGSLPGVKKEMQLSPQPSLTQTITAKQTLRLEEDHVFMEENKKTGDQSTYWMWHNFVESGTKTISFALPQEIKETTVTTSVLLGYEPDYLSVSAKSLWFQVNGQILPVTVESFREGLASATAAIAPGLLHSGTNEISLSFLNAVNYPSSKQQTYLDAVVLQYACSLYPGAIPFDVSSSQIINQAIPVPPGTESAWILRNNGHRPADVLRIKEKNTSFMIPQDGAEWKLLFLPATHSLTSITAEPVLPKEKRSFDLNDPRQTDIIFITRREWCGLLMEYSKSLVQEGYTNRVLAVEDMYDYFGDGRLSPQAIKDFLRYAEWNWAAPLPSYVILIGDSTCDYWGRYKNGIINYVPAYRDENEYAVENWFVRCDDANDPIPDMMIARWPVRNQQEIQNIVQKTLAYKKQLETGPWLNNVFLLTDDNFEQYSDELAESWIPKEFRLTRRHIKDYSLVDNVYLPERLRLSMRAKTSLEATADIIDSINQGQFLWEFFGHGAPNVMGEERMFFGGGSKFSEVKKLTNQKKLPVLWAFTCETAKFDYAKEKWNISIGEDLLTWPNGGIISMLGATGRGYPRDHTILAKALHEAAFHYQLETHGQIFLAALLMGAGGESYFEPLKQFALLGDPTVRFPEFITINGTIEKQDANYAYQWQIPEDLRQTKASVWSLTGRNVAYMEQKEVNNQVTLTGTIPLRPMKKETEEELGIDIVTRKNNRVVIGHGAVAIPQPKAASAWIEPVTGRLPDLSFVSGSMILSPSSPRSGETIFIEAKVQNTGKASAKDVSILGYDGDQNKNRNPLHVEVGERSIKIKQIDPGQVIPVKTRWDPINNTGPHELFLEIESNRSLEEENRENNRISASVMVRKKADLIVDASSVTVLPIEEGKRVQLSFTIKNVGESEAEKIPIQVAVKLRNEPKESTIYLPRFVNLKPGETYTAGGIRISADMEWLKIIIDPDEIVDEEFHDNNSYLYRNSPPNAGSN